jgi:hypothetical protein
MKMWALRRIETEEDAERPIALEALGTEMIVADGEASTRAEVEDISRWCGGELTAARGGSRGCGSDGLRSGGAEEP